MQPELAAIPARMLNEVVYCPRLYCLEHVAGEWDDNADTVSGRRVHRRVDAGTSAMPPPGEVPWDGLQARSVTVASETDGIVAKLDVIESAGGQVTPVDYKRGSAPDPTRVPGGVWPADRVQTAAQVMALRASGYACSEGVVYYAASKTRVSVPVDDERVAEVRRAVADARLILQGGVMPPPLVDSPKCPRCSLVGICLPDETNLLRSGAEPSEDGVTVRRLLPGDDGRFPCHVQANGATIGKKGGVLEVRMQDGSKQDVRTREVSHLSVFGQVHVTPGVIHELCSQGIGVSFFSSGGWYYGALQGVATVNVGHRIEQFRAAGDAGASLALARAFVVGKILNCRTLLRRNADPPPARALAQLKSLAEEASRIASIESLLGVEGTAARTYFAELGSLLQPRSGASASFEFTHRNRRPPRDPVNALLSLGYALLLKDCRVALLSVGLDPTVGFLHQPRPGRPALALDVMEEFRPLVVDSVVLSVVNTEEVSEGDFVSAAGAVALNERGRRAFLAAYERRMRQEVTHPIFGYRISYRRVLEVQARLLARTLIREIPAYPSFQTR